MKLCNPRPFVWLAALLLLALTTPAMGQHVVGEYLEADVFAGNRSQSGSWPWIAANVLDTVSP